jgi:hypothetical protein
VGNLEPMRILALVLATLATLCSVSARTFANSGDAAATGAYIGANYTLVAAARARLKTSEAAITGVLRQVRGQCPGVVAESPQNRDSEQLSNEVVGTITIAAIRPDAAAIVAFARAVARLHWSDAALTSTIAAYTHKLEAQSRFPAPDLCGDLRAWAASGYQRLPASTVRFDGSFFPLDIAIGLLPKGLPSAGVSSAQREILQRSKKLEAQLTEGEARAVFPWGQIMEALGLNP